MSHHDELVKEVEAVFSKSASEQTTPKDTDLYPVYSLLLPNASDGTSPSAAPPNAPSSHWYCSKALSSIHREAATYLIILFAFRREGMSGLWVTALEGVLSSCDECARSFGAARRRFGTKWVRALTSLQISLRRSY